MRCSRRTRSAQLFEGWALFLFLRFGWRGVACRLGLSEGGGGLAVGTNTAAKGLKRSLASTGHRGRVDARGRPLGRAPGLTRTTGLPAAAPSREGRRRSAFGGSAWAKHSREEAGSRLPGAGSWRCAFGCVVAKAAPTPRSPGGRFLAARSSQRSAEGAAHRPSREGTPAPRSVFRVKPGAPSRRWPRASTRPRWPVDAKPPFKTTTRICPNRQARHGEAGESFL